MNKHSLELEVFVAVVDVLDTDPSIYSEDMQDVDASQWDEVVKSKMESMYSNGIWTLVNLLENVSHIGCSGFTRGRKMLVER